MHKLLSNIGSVFIVAGLGVAVYMVGASGGPHFRSLHGVIGGAFALSLFVVLTWESGGLCEEQQPSCGTIHILTGYLTLGLMVINLFSG